MAQAHRQPRGSGFASRIRGERDTILRSWRAALAREQPLLVEQAPHLLEWIADLVEQGPRGSVPLAAAGDHGELAEVVHELAELREAIALVCDGDADHDELRALHRAIDAAIEVAVAGCVDAVRALAEANAHAVRQREDVLALVSHDLRNPLGAIDLSATMLLPRVGDDPRAKKQLDTIRRSAQRMMHLIGDLLDVASIQAGRLALERKPVHAQAIVDEAIELHAAAAADRGMILQGPCGLGDLRLDCDRDRVVQVFVNLLGNAIKFGRSGDRVVVECAPEGELVRFVVRDTGPGIAPDDLPHLFEPYYSARGHAKQGSGLGLSICKGIITAHGGTIEVTSAPGAGATFAFTLPVAR